MVRKYGRAGKIWTDDDLAMVASKSTLPKISFLSDASAGDYYQFVVPFDCKVVSGDFYQAGDEGTDGVLNVEKWDVVAGGGYQTPLFVAYDVNAGAAAIEALTLSTTEADLYLLEGDSINLLMTTASGSSVQCHITIVVETLELVKY